MKRSISLKPSNKVRWCWQGNRSCLGIVISYHLQSNHLSKYSKTENLCFSPSIGLHNHIMKNMSHYFHSFSSATIPLAITATTGFPFVIPLLVELNNHGSPPNEASYKIQIMMKKPMYTQPTMPNLDFLVVKFPFSLFKSNLIYICSMENHTRFSLIGYKRQIHSFTILVHNTNIVRLDMIMI